MLNRCLLCLFTSVILFSCSSVTYDERAMIENIKEQQNVVLNIDNNRYVHSILIKIIGVLKGKAVLNLVSDEGVQDTITLSTGIVKQFINKEWYSEKCVLEYKPINVTSGQLSIEYKIKYVKK